jgi:hypothetical protein
VAIAFYCFGIFKVTIFSLMIIIRMLLDFVSHLFKYFFLFVIFP